MALPEDGTDSPRSLRLPLPVSPGLADSRPQATAGSTSTIANRSVISVDNSSRDSPSRSSTPATALCNSSNVLCQRWNAFFLRNFHSRSISFRFGE
jgi:hypothetical protein